jgi:LysR family transcriptional regulator, low CO2-responsive transcriptional regulator
MVMIESSWLTALTSFALDENMSRAAKRLHLSQPAVHAQLKKLGAALDVTLYRRVGRGLKLTPEGIEVLAFARDLDERTAELGVRLHQLEAERLVLAAGEGAIMYVLGEGLRSYVKTSAARVELSVLDANQTVEAVKSGLSHVGVAVLERAPPGLEVTPVTSVEQLLVMPRAHRLASRRRIELGDLAGERLIVPPEGRPHRALLDAAFRARGISPEIGVVARGWELTLKLVELGLGMAVVNACCRIPRGLLTRPLRELGRVSYVAVTRKRPRDAAAELVKSLVRHGEAWRRPGPVAAR